jgi:signal transduction histidine kinase
VRLADFIAENHDAILADWETFAATRTPAASDMTRQELRDHARQLLDAAVEDLRSEQTALEQKRKAEGMGTARRMYRVAQEHALARARSGFRVDQLLAEYRAMRASVIRLWEQHGSAQRDDVDRADLTRFNEAIDEAVTESVGRFTEQVEKYRDQFLAVLGHDLRNPLGAIKMTATFLSRSEDLSERHAKSALRIVNAAERANRIVSDLLDLTRTRLGQGISLERRPTNFGQVCRQVVDELEALHPDRELRLTCEGDLRGEWDEGRLAQIVSNLVGNALQHGDATKPVTVRVRPEAGRQDGQVVLTVHNWGPTIPEASLKTIFDPMVRSSTAGDYFGQPSSLGLGLFIVRELVSAHGGTVAVRSSDAEGTTFTVQMPRRT